MAFTVYDSADIGAPTLNGATGSLLTVLDACLVTGYGSKPGAGWVKPFPNTGSVGVIQIPSPGITCSLFISDVSASVTNEAMVCGYELITSISNGKPTGSRPFPTSTQGVAIALGSGGYLTIRKSNALDSTARQWTIFADSRSVYIFNGTGDSGGGYYGYMFGEFYSTKSGSFSDWRCMLIARAANNSITDHLSPQYIINSTVNDGYICRTYDGAIGSVGYSKHGDIAKANGRITDGYLQFPNGKEVGLYISPIWLWEGISGVRGRLRGLSAFLNNTNMFYNKQIIVGTDDCAGRTFQIVKNVVGLPNGIYVMEISDTLETN